MSAALWFWSVHPVSACQVRKQDTGTDRMAGNAASVFADGDCNYCAGIFGGYYLCSCPTMGLFGMQGNYSGDHMSAVFFLLDDFKYALLLFCTSTHTGCNRLAVAQSLPFPLPSAFSTGCWSLILHIRGRSYIRFVNLQMRTRSWYG